MRRPRQQYEGVAYPSQPSAHGSATGAQQLRDPFVMMDKEQLVVFYTVAGEEGIGGAWVN
ncbi:MAG: hypothetical protein IBX56_11385 [Methylomicrobium sp.]|nr:hypothetical protein [Methylomicrobium sp.]